MKKLWLVAVAALLMGISTLTGVYFILTGQVSQANSNATANNAGGFYYDTSFKLPVFSDGNILQYVLPGMPFSDMSCIMPGAAAAFTNFGLPVSSVGTVASFGGVLGFGIPSGMHTVTMSTSAAANQNAEAFSAIAPAVIGNAAGVGGFAFYARWWMQGTSPFRAFIGLANTTAAIPTGDPDTIINSIAVEAQSGDANYSICSNDAAGTATCTTLGASFPINNALLFFDLLLYAAPNASSVNYTIRSNSGATVSSGTISSDLPANTVYLAPHVWANNSTSGAVVNIHLNRYCMTRPF